MESSLQRCGILYPFGYRAPDAETYFQSLMMNTFTCIVEARFTPYARHRPLWCRYGKCGLEQVWKERYHYFSNRTQAIDQNDSNWLGNSNYKTGGPIALVNVTQGCDQLALLLTQGWNIVLVCGCPEYDLCHRKSIVEELRRIMPSLSVVHQQCISTEVKQPQRFQQMHLF